MGLVHDLDYGTPASKSEKMVTLTIDDRQITVPEGTSTLKTPLWWAASAGVPA